MRNNSIWIVLFGVSYTALMHKYFIAQASYAAYLIRTRKPSNAKKYSIETAEELFNLYSPYTRKLRDLGKLFHLFNSYNFPIQALIFRGRSQKRLTLKTEVTHFKIRSR